MNAMLGQSSMSWLGMSRAVLSITAGGLLLLLVPASVAAWRVSDQKVTNVIVPLVFEPPDAVFILTVLATLGTFYLFYDWILPHARERISDDLVSLGLAVWFFFQSFFLFLENAVPYRGLIASVPLFVAWYKNGRLWARHRQSPMEALFEDWFRKSRWTAVWTLASGCVFALLMHSRSREMIFGAGFARSAPIGRHFDHVVPLLFYIPSLAISLRSLARTYLVFRNRGDQYVHLLQGKLREKSVGATPPGTPSPRPPGVH